MSKNPRFRRTKEEIALGFSLEEAQALRDKKPPKRPNEIKLKEIKSSTTKKVLSGNIDFKKTDKVIFSGLCRIHEHPHIEGHYTLCLNNVRYNGRKRKRVITDGIKLDDGTQCRDFHKDCHVVHIEIKSVEKSV